MTVVDGEDGQAGLEVMRRHTRRAYVPRDGPQEAEEDEDGPSALSDENSDDEVMDEEEALGTDMDVSLAHEEEAVSEADRLQYAAVQQLSRTGRRLDDDDADMVEQYDMRHPVGGEGNDAAVERGQRLVMTYGGDPLSSIDPRWFVMVFPDSFWNGTGLPPEGVSMERWLRHLIQRDGSPFQKPAFVVAAANVLMRAGVNLAAYLSFKASPRQFMTAREATSSDVMKVAEMLARRGRPDASHTDKVKALYKQVVSVSARVKGSPFNSLAHRNAVFAGWYWFGYTSVFYTLNPLETRSPYCWAIAGADDVPLRPKPGPDPPPKEWEFIKRVRGHPVAAAVFYETVITTFREVSSRIAAPHALSSPPPDPSL